MRPCTHPRSICWLVLAAVVALSVSGCDEPDGNASVTSASSPGAQQRLIDLVAPPHDPFQVIFERQDERSPAEGYLVWRQGNGMRRWDEMVVSSEDGESKGGEISIDSDFSSDLVGGRSRLVCVWLTPANTAGNADTHCGGGPLTGTGLLALEGILRASVTMRLDDQVIAGRDVSCYSSESPASVFKLKVEMFCVDSQGIPLRIVARNQQYPEVSFSIEAASASTEPRSLLVPFGLQPGPSGAYSDFDATVPLSDLLLPELP